MWIDAGYDSIEEKCYMGVHFYFYTTPEGRLAPYADALAQWWAELDTEEMGLQKRNIP